MNWVFMGSSNMKMSAFIGKECAIITPRRKDDGHRVLYACNPKDREKWYFYTSTIVSVTREELFEDGYAVLTVRTHNSEYKFWKKCD